METVTVRMSRSDESTPWGFRLQGGAEFNAPLTISSVNPSSLADRAGLQNGDQLNVLGGRNCDHLKHTEAQNCIAACGNNLDLVVHRTGGGAQIWKPSIKTLDNETTVSKFQHSVHGIRNDGNLAPPNYQPPPPPSSVPLSRPVQVSLEHHAPTASPIPGYNRSAQPFANTKGGATYVYNSPESKQATQNASESSIKHLQYNSPINMYSTQNVAETYKQQTGGGLLKADQTQSPKEEPAYLKSPTLRLIQEEQFSPKRASEPRDWADGRSETLHHTDANTQSGSFKRLSGAMGTPADESESSTRSGRQSKTSSQDASSDSTSSSDARDVSPSGRSPSPRPDGVPVCYGCRQVIIGVFCKAEGRSYHPDCYNCATCGTSLRNVGYVLHRGKLYCNVHGNQLKHMHFGAAPPVNPNAFASRAPQPQQPRYTGPPKAFYQPEIMTKGPVRVSPMPWKSPSPISPSTRGVPRAPAMYGSDLTTAANHMSNLSINVPIINAPHQGFNASAAPPAPPPPPPPTQSGPERIKAMTDAIIMEDLANISGGHVIAQDWPPSPSPQRDGSNKYWIIPEIDYLFPSLYQPKYRVEKYKLSECINEMDRGKAPEPKRELLRGSAALSPRSLKALAGEKIQLPNAQGATYLQQHHQEQLYHPEEEHRRYHAEENIIETVINETTENSLSKDTLEKNTTDAVRSTSDLSSAGGDAQNEESLNVVSEIEDDEYDAVKMPDRSKEESQDVSEDPIKMAEHIDTPSEMLSPDAEKASSADEGSFVLPKFDNEVTEFLKFELNSEANSEANQLEREQDIAVDQQPNVNGGTSHETLKKDRELEECPLQYGHEHSMTPSVIADSQTSSDMIKTVNFSEILENPKVFSLEKQQEILSELLDKAMLHLEKLTTEIERQRQTSGSVVERPVPLTPLNTPNVLEESDIENYFADSLCAELLRPPQYTAALVSVESSKQIGQQRCKHYELLREDHHQEDMQHQQQQQHVSKVYAHGGPRQRKFITPAEMILARLRETGSQEREEATQSHNAYALGSQLTSAVQTPRSQLSPLANKVGQHMANGGLSPKDSSSQPRRGRGMLKQLHEVPRVPFCQDCGREIRGPFVLATGKTWCPEHFVCANSSCRRKLLDCGFVEENGQKYCESCFENYMAPRCAKCSKPITGDCLNAIQKQFHPECFVCSHCHQPFGNSAFFLEEGRPYCERDWNQLYTTKCIACKFPIEAGDRWVEAIGNAYHSNCFNCTTCHKNLEGQSFYAKSGLPFCKQHA